MASVLKVDKLDPQSATALEIGTSGDTINVPSGVTLDINSGATLSNSGTATGFAAISWQAIETGSTMTAVAGEGYWVDTTSNACTITLPASASNGDTIIFADYARTWGTNGIILDSNGLNYQGDPDTFDVEYTTDGQSVHIVYSGATKGWIPISDDDVADVPAKTNDNGIFAYGNSGSLTAVSNIVSSAGVVAADVTGVGTAREALAACEYGDDKGIFGYGDTGSVSSLSNLVSSSGVIATDVTGVGSARKFLAAADYGGDKAIFAYGDTGSVSSLSNLVSNSGVIATDVTGVGTARSYLAACEYGANRATSIFAYGYNVSAANVNLSNLVSDTGVIATDTTGVGTARRALAACSYGGDKGIFSYGWISGNVNNTNLVSNTGVVSTDVSGVGTARHNSAATQYGGDKGIFGFGQPNGLTAITNLVSTSGVIASDTAGVGTARNAQSSCSYN